MSVCRARLRNTFNVLTFWMSGEQIHLQFSPKLWVVQCVVAQMRVLFCVFIFSCQHQCSNCLMGLVSKMTCCMSSGSVLCDWCWAPCCIHSIYGCAVPCSALKVNVSGLMIIITFVLRQTAQPYTRYTTYNSLPCRAAMTRYTDCHAGPQQQPGLAQRV